MSGVVPGFRGADVAHKPARARNFAIVAWIMVVSLTVAFIEPRAVGGISRDAFDGLVALVGNFSDSLVQAINGATSSIDRPKSSASVVPEVASNPVASVGSSVITGSVTAAAPKVASPVSPALSLSATSGLVGTELTISGARFPSGQPLLITWDGAVVGSQAVTPDGGGAFQKKIVVPATSPGAHLLAVTTTAGAASGGKQNVVVQVASAVFMVAVAGAATGPTSAPLSQPAATLPAAPSSALTGATAPPPSATSAPTAAPTTAPTSAPTAAPSSAPSAPAVTGTNVRSYGAVGDGLTDDTAAIIRARDAAGVGGTLSFPAGTYFVAGMRANVSGQVWELDSAATLKLRDAANASLLAITGAGVRVSGGRIDGNGAAQTNFGTCIDTYASNVTIQGVDVGNCHGWGIYAYSADNTTISGNSVHDTNDAGIFIEHGSDNATIDRNLVSRTVKSNAGGIVVHNQQNSAAVGYGTRITNNRVEGAGQISIESWSPNSVVQGNTTVGGDIGISVGGSDGTKVLGNTVLDARGYGIEFGNSGNGTVSGNTVSDVAGDAGIILDDAAHDNTVTGNTVKRVVRGVQVSYHSPRNTISANVIDSWSLFGIEAHSSDNSIIDVNTFVGAGRQVVLINP